MGVYKVILSGKRVSWRYSFTIGSRADYQQFRQGGFATKAEAVSAEAEKRLEIERAVKVKSTGTLGHAINKFFEDRGADLSPKTLARYRELAAYLHVDLLGLPVADVKAMTLHEEWRRLKDSGGHHRKTKALRPLSAKTVRNIASVVSAALSWAVLYGLIPHNPASDSRPPSGPKRKGLALAPSQTELMVNAAEGWLADFLDVERGMGIRRGEALAIRSADIGVDPVSGKPAVHITRSLGQIKDGTQIPVNVQWLGSGLYFKGTKSGEDRWVEFSSTVAAAFERRRQEQARLRTLHEYDKTSDLVFTGPFGEPLRPDSVSSKVSLHCKRVKMPKGVSLHTLRHSHASQLVADGHNIAAISDRMGHSDAAVTLGIYTHAIPKKEDLAKAWEEIQKKKPQ
jgi:integrase